MRERGLVVRVRELVVRVRGGLVVRVRGGLVVRVRGGLVMRVRGLVVRMGGLVVRVRRGLVEREKIKSKKRDKGLIRLCMYACTHIYCHVRVKMYCFSRLLQYDFH